MPRIVQMFNTTTLDGQPVQVYQTDDGKYLHSDDAQKEIAAGRLVAQKSDYPAQSSVQGIKMPVKTASEEVRAREYNQGATAQTNLPAAQGIANKYDYSPAAFQTTLQQAGVADTKEGQKAYQDYTKNIAPTGEDINRRVDFELGPVTDVAKQHVQGVPQTPFEKTAMSLGEEAVSGMPEKEGQLGRPMEKTEADFAKAREASMQQEEKPVKETTTATGKSTTAGGAGMIYSETDNPIEFAIARKLANGEINFQQAISIYPAFGQKGQKRENIIATAMKINPKFSPSSQMIAYGGEQSHAKAAAQLRPDVVSGKVGQQARGGTARQLNMQRQAAQRATSTFDDALKNSGGKYENIPTWMYRDLAMDYAKILTLSGQIAEGSVDKVMQASAQGKLKELWNYTTGDTKTTAPQKVLELMHQRIKSLGVDLDKQYYNQVQGQNMPITSNSATNPMKTTGIPTSGAKGNAPTLSTRAEVQALPSGAHFIYNGVEHVKK